LDSFSRAKPLSGITAGVIVKILDDGRIAWRPGGRKTELIARPENLVQQKP
jgi:hypothetical protein